MPRIDLPKIEDQPWCPAWLRDAMTGYLRVVNDVLRQYAATELVVGYPNPPMNP